MAEHRTAEQLRASLVRLADTARTWVAVLGAAILVLEQVPWLDEQLSRLGLRDTPTYRTLVFTILLTTILLEVREVARRQIPPSSARQHFADPQEMYQALLSRAKSIKNANQRQLDVLGLTLYSAWPVISFWLQRPEINGWTVRLATMDPHADAVACWVPDDWPHESGVNAAQAQQFANGSLAASKNHHLEIIEYGFVPSIHGFRLGNGDVFVSSLLWQDDGRLGKAGFSYEFIPHEEAGPGATALRELFDNWFGRARRSHQERQATLA